MWGFKNKIVYSNDFTNEDFKINLLPNRLHYISLAKNLPKSVWNKFRKVHINDKNGTCELCGLKMDSRHNCHEIFEVDNETIRLIGIKVLCYNCHMTQHIGFVSTGKSGLSIDDLKKHYEKISGRNFDKESHKAIKEYDEITNKLKGKKFKFEIDDNLLGKKIIEGYRESLEKNINSKV